MKRAFVTIEAIIAFVVLTFAVLTTVSSVRTLNLYQQRKSLYEDLYMSVLSVKDMIKNENLEKRKFFKGKINGFDYNATVKIEDVKHNMVMDEFFGYSPGTYQVTLYRIFLEMRRKNFLKDFSFLLTQEKLLKEYQYKP